MHESPNLSRPASAMSLARFQFPEPPNDDFLAPCYDNLPHVLPPKMTNVWVYEVGSAKYPGDEMILHIATRKLRRLCFPAVFLDAGMPPGFPATMFLKPSPNGIVNSAAVGFVTVAITFGTWDLDYNPDVQCDCTDAHDCDTHTVLDFDEVRRMSPVRVSYTNGRGPYHLPIGDEVSRLVAALENAAFVEDDVAHRARVDAARVVETNKYGLVVYSTPRSGVLQGKGTRAQERARGKQARLAKMLAGGPFLTARTHRVGVAVDVCCEARDCASRFSVSNASQEGLDRVMWYRNIFQALDEEKRRQFIARRIRYEVVGEGDDGSAHKRWTLESPDAISTMVRGGRAVQIDVGTKATTVVCGDFFCYVWGSPRTSCTSQRLSPQNSKRVCHEPPTHVASTWSGKQSMWPCGCCS